MEEERVLELLKERSVLLRKEIEKGKISPKIAAGFAVTFFEGLDKNYDEKTMVFLMKKIMEFFNDGIRNIPEFLEEKRIREILEELEHIKKSGEKTFGKTIPENGDNDSFDFGKAEDTISELKTIKMNLRDLEDEKPKVFKKGWREKILQNLFDLIGIEKNLNNMLELKEQKNLILKENLKINLTEIKESLKKIVFETDKEIGAKLALQGEEEIIENEDNLKVFVYDSVIITLCKFYQEKNKTRESSLKAERED
ncbi:MAG: hypothetical protein ACRCTS_06485 [Fusobacteriaceae bacterium]